MRPTPDRETVLEDLRSWRDRLRETVDSDDPGAILESVYWSDQLSRLEDAIDIIVRLTEALERVVALGQPYAPQGPSAQPVSMYRHIRRAADEALIALGREPSVERQVEDATD